MTQVSVRDVDDVILQMGHDLGTLEGAAIVEVDAATADEIEAAMAQPNGGVTLSDAGVVGILPPPPPPLVPIATLRIAETAQTTDATATEIHRIACETGHIYQGNLMIFGADRGNFATKTMEGRFVWKRATANAIVSGITVVSDIHDTAAAAWAPNCQPSGPDVVFTVAGAAGRTIDWALSGVVEVFAPGETGG